MVRLRAVVFSQSSQGSAGLERTKWPRVYGCPEVLGITNNFLYPSNDKIYGIEPRYSEQILLVPRSPFVISRFYCTWLDCEPSFSVSRVKARQDWREQNGREYMVVPGEGLMECLTKQKKIYLRNLTG